MLYLNDFPARNQEYTLYIDAYNASAFGGTSSSAFSSIKISKDGSNFVDASNTVTYLNTTGMFSLILTADEMNANIVLVRIDALVDQCIHIKTCPTELSAIPSTSSDFMSRMLAIFQYFFMKRTATTTTETMYKNDSSTPLATSTLTNNGTTASRTKVS